MEACKEGWGKAEQVAVAKSSYALLSKSPSCVTVHDGGIAFQQLLPCAHLQHSDA